MSRGLSVITTIRGDEPRAEQTLVNMAQKAGCPVEVIAVFDGQMPPHEELPCDQLLVHTTPRGIGPSRHRGIKAAKYSVVLLVDAHMDFEQDYGKIILNHYRLKKHAKDVTCGRCIPALADLTPMSGSEGYTGARFTLKSEETGGEKWCLSGKWADQEVNSEIGCVFGACYAFTKKWYDEIGEPLNLLNGWFGDEEYLSIASWLAGGRCYLLDYWVSHFFRDHPSFQWSRDDWMLPSLNRARLIDLFPADPDLKLDLQAWNLLSVRASDDDFVKLQKKDAKRKEVIAAKELWSSWSDNVQGFLSRWVDESAAPLEERLKMRDEARPWKHTTDAPIVAAEAPTPRVQSRNYIVCPNCGEYNSLRVDRTVTQGEERRRYGRCGNGNCKIRGVLVNRKDSQIMYWGKQADRI